MMMEKIILIPILNALLGANLFVNPATLISNSLFSKKAIAVEDSINIDPYLLPATETSYFPIRDWGISDPVLNSRSVVIYDLKSDKIIFSISPDDRLPIASLTKLMTAVVVIEDMSLDDTVEVRKSAIERSKKEGGGQDLYTGEKIKAGELLRLMLIDSSNDSAYAFDEHLAEIYGISLVEKMNRKAAELGMLDTFFTEAAGLDDKNSFSTTRDLIKLVKYSFRYDLLYDILKTDRAEILSIDGRLKHQALNTNKLIGILLNIIGGKTGFTELAGGSMVLVTRAPVGESNLVSIVLGSNERFNDTEALVNWAVKAFIWK